MIIIVTINDGLVFVFFCRVSHQRQNVCLVFLAITFLFMCCQWSNEPATVTPVQQNHHTYWNRGISTLAVDRVRHFANRLNRP
jgi:hypothetical protein